MSSPLIRSRRGIARVSAVWMISVMVLFFVAIGFGFVAYTDATAAQKDREEALAARTQAQAAANDARAVTRAISEATGWYDRDAASPETNVDALTADLELLRDRIPGAGGAENFQDLVAPMLAALTNAAEQRKLLEGRIQGLQTELDSAQRTNQQIGTDHDQALADLRSQLSDLEDTLNRQKDDLESRLAQASATNSELDIELRNARSDAKSQLGKKDEMIAQLEVQVARMRDQLNFIERPNSNMPDGRVLQVSEALGLGFIDIGAEQRVVPGIRFRVESGNMGSRRVKGFAEVVDVEPLQAKVRFYDVADEFDPVTPGDVIVNELFDPRGKRSAVLAGRFSAPLGEKELVAMLERIGVEVLPADSIDRTVDFLIVGSELWNDPEFNEPLEQPIQPSELPVYKEAESLGLSIIPLKYVRQYFRL